MSVGAWLIFDTFPLYLEEQGINLSSDTLMLALFTSASNANDRTKSLYGDLTDELANANGYTTGGFALSSVTLTQSGATVKLASADLTIAASGGNLVFRYAVIYDATPTSPLKPLIACSLLDTTPADTTVLNGQSTIIQNDPTNGIITTTRT